MKIESEKHRKSDEKSGQRKSRDGFPVLAQKFLFGDDKSDKESDENQRGNSKSNVPVHPQAKKYSRPDIVGEFSRVKSFKKKIESENQNKRKHIGPKRNPVEINGPERSGIEKSGNKPGPICSEKFPGEKHHSRNRQNAEKNGPHFESDDIHSEKHKSQSDKIHKKPLAAVIIGIEEFKMAGFDGVYSVGSVHGFIGINSRRKRAQVISAGKDGNEKNCSGQRQVEMSMSEK